MAITHSLDLEASSSQHVEIADASQTGLDLAGDWTIEFWIKPESQPAGGNQMGLVAKSNSGDNNRSYVVSLLEDTTQKILASISDDGTNQDQVRFSNDVGTGTWVHIAITCDVSNAVATEFELFVNTVSAGNGSVALDDTAGAVFNGTADFNIGALNNTAGSFYDGLICDVRVWSDIRTQAEIAANWKTSTPAGDNLQFHGYVVNNHNDLTANNNDLTASNSPVFSTDVPYVETTATQDGYSFLM